MQILHHFIYYAKIVLHNLVQDNFLLSNLLWHVFKTCWGSGTKEIHPHIKSILNLYSKQLTGEATTIAKSYLDGSIEFVILKRISSCAFGCIIDLLAGSQSTTNKFYLEFKISKTIDSWKKCIHYITLHSSVVFRPCVRQYVITPFNFVLVMSARSY